MKSCLFLGAVTFLLILVASQFIFTVTVTFGLHTRDHALWTWTVEGPALHLEAPTALRNWACSADDTDSDSQLECLHGLAAISFLRRAFDTSNLMDCSAWLADPSNWLRNWTARRPRGRSTASNVEGHIKPGRVYEGLPVLLGQLGHCPASVDVGGAWLVEEHLTPLRRDTVIVFVSIGLGPQFFFARRPDVAGDEEVLVAAISCVAALLGPTVLALASYGLQFSVADGRALLDRIQPAKDWPEWQPRERQWRPTRALDWTCQRLVELHKRQPTHSRQGLNASAPTCATYQDFQKVQKNGACADRASFGQLITNLSLRGNPGYVEYQQCTAGCLGRTFPWEDQAPILAAPFQMCLCCCAYQHKKQPRKGRKRGGIRRERALSELGSCDEQWARYDADIGATPSTLSPTAFVTTGRPTWRLAVVTAGMRLVHDCWAAQKTATFIHHMNRWPSPFDDVLRGPCPARPGKARQWGPWQRRFEIWWGDTRQGVLGFEDYVGADERRIAKGMVFNSKVHFSKVMRGVPAVPRSFGLPDQYSEAVVAFQAGGWWALKPHIGRRGDGVRVISARNGGIDDVVGSRVHVTSQLEPTTIGQLQEVVEPLLLPPGARGKYPSHKFDIRLYVVVTQWEPVLRAYLHPEGVVRYAYLPWNSQNVSANKPCAFITNTGMVKCRDNASKATQADLTNLSLRDWPTVSTLSALLAHIEEHYGQGSDLRTLSGIAWAIQHVLVAVSARQGGAFWVEETSNATAGGRPFNVLGVDVALDESLRAWVLEVNQRPDDYKGLREMHSHAMGLLKLNMARNVLSVLGLPGGFDRRAYGCRAQRLVEAACPGQGALGLGPGQPPLRRRACDPAQLRALLDEHHAKGTLLRLAPNGRGGGLWKAYGAGREALLANLAAESFVHEHLLEGWVRHGP